jgi:FHA domain-containing protein
MARLVMKKGKNAGKTFELADKPVILGRGDTVQIRVHDAKASREHCRVFAQGHQWVVADLNSRNGISVNGVTKTRHTLRNGDEIAIGETVIAFEGDAATKAAEPERGKSARMAPADKQKARAKAAKDKAFATARSDSGGKAGSSKGGGGDGGGGTLQVSDNVLQFSKQESSFLGIDLGQMSVVQQMIMWLLVLGALGGLGWMLAKMFAAE